MKRRGALAQGCIDDGSCRHWPPDTADALDDKDRVVIEEHIIYEYIPRPLYAGERHEIARTDEEQMPLKQTKAYSLAMAYASATGRRMAIDPWTDRGFQKVGNRVLGYRIGEELVCVECGLKRLDPNRAAVIDYIRRRHMEIVRDTNGERLACQDCGQEIFSPKPLFPQQRGASEKTE